MSLTQSINQSINHKPSFLHVMDNLLKLLKYLVPESLSKMSSRGLPWGYRRPLPGLATLPHSCTDRLRILKASTSWSTLGLSRPALGQSYFLNCATFCAITDECHFHRFVSLSVHNYVQSETKIPTVTAELTRYDSK